jgi:hypothetical protein
MGPKTGMFAESYSLDGNPEHRRDAYQILLKVKWQCLNLRPLPQGHGSLRRMVRRAISRSRSDSKSMISAGARCALSNWTIVFM